MFMNSGWQPFFENRRTGFPIFQCMMDLEFLITERIPQRWMYPADESINNALNLTEALSRQYLGEDSINATMWILKE